MYYIYHIPGKKIGVTNNLLNRVTKAQGYKKDEYEIILQSEDINFIADQSHIETLQKQLPESINKKINYYSIELPKKHYEVLSIWHYFKILKSLKSILKETDKIILLSFFSWNLLGLKLFLLSNTTRDQRFFFICHGVLEFLYDLKSFKRFKKY